MKKMTCSEKENSVPWMDATEGKWKDLEDLLTISLSTNPQNSKNIQNPTFPKELLTLLMQRISTK